MPAEMQERTPGVYIREEETPHELDMLWSSSKGYVREDRSPILIFIAGFVLGAIITAAVFLLLNSRPQINLGESDLMQPISEETVAPGEGAASPAPAGNESGAAKTTSNYRAQAKTHTVGSGDTLGGIAIKYYGSSAPQYVDKLQRANSMSSPDSLQLGQKLVIPPKNY